MKKYESPSQLLFIKVPTDGTTPGQYAMFTYIFDSAVFKREVMRFIRKNKFSSFPDEYIRALEEEFRALQLAFLNIVGHSIVRAIRSGGFLSSVVGYANGKPIFKPVSEMAGLSRFNSRSGQLASAAVFNAKATERGGKGFVKGQAPRVKLVVTWGKGGGDAAPDIPGPYVDTNNPNTIPFKGEPPLQVMHKEGVVDRRISKVANIESGSPYQRQLTNTAMKGFFPASGNGYRIFEGAVYKNVKALEKVYEMAVRDIFDSNIFTLNGRKYDLDKYADRFLSKTVREYYNQNIAPKKLAPTGIPLKANEQAFFDNLKRISPDRSKFISSLNNAEIRALFKVFKLGKGTTLAKQKIGLADTEKTKKFQDSIKENVASHLESLGMKRIVDEPTIKGMR